MLQKKQRIYIFLKTKLVYPLNRNSRPDFRHKCRILWAVIWKSWPAYSTFRRLGSSKMQQLVRSIRARTLFPRADDIWQSGDLLSSHRTYKYLWWRRVLLEFMMAIFFAFFGAVFVDFGWLALLADLAWLCPAGIYSYFIIYHALYEAAEQHTYIFAFIISNCLWPSVKMPHKTTRKRQNCKLLTTN